MTILEDELARLSLDEVGDDMMNSSTRITVLFELAFAFTSKCNDVFVDVEDELLDIDKALKL